MGVNGQQVGDGQEQPISLVPTVEGADENVRPKRQPQQLPAVHPRFLGEPDQERTGRAEQSGDETELATMGTAADNEEQRNDQDRRSERQETDGVFPAPRRVSPEVEQRKVKGRVGFDREALLQDVDERAGAERSAEALVLPEALVIQAPGTEKERSQADGNREGQPAQSRVAVWSRPVRCG